LSKESREVIDEATLHSKIASGLEKVYMLAKAGYGPGAGNVMIEQKYGDPLLSRDGVTNIRRLYLEDPVENMAARAVIQASSMNNRNVGDGTTAAALLTYLLYKGARKLVVAGYGRMQVAAMLRDTQYSILDEIATLAKPFTKEMLLNVAKTSTGDDAIAQMLEEVFTELGDDAGVLVESYSGADISSEIVDGFYFDKGWTKVGLTNQPSNLRSYHEGNVPILVSEKRLLTKADIGPVLETLVQNGVRELILVGEVSDEVIEVLAANWMSGIISVVPVDPPYYEGMRTLFMDDLALLIDAEVYVPGASPEDFNINMLGYAEKVVIDERSTKIIGGDGLDEAVGLRIAELKAQLEAATSPIDVEALRKRISQLTGKLAIIRVGGVTELEREELKLRIDDAVSAIRAAFRSGVVPGGGVTLARVNGGQFTEDYQGLIKALAENSGLNPESILGTVLGAKPWVGYDFKKAILKPEDLLKAGVVDPAQVVSEVVKNATSIAASLITANAGTVFVDRESKID
jgi:chaperonin GroEL